MFNNLKQHDKDIKKLENSGNAVKAAEKSLRKAQHEFNEYKNELKQKSLKRHSFFNSSAESGDKNIDNLDVYLYRMDLIPSSTIISQCQEAMRLDSQLRTAGTALLAELKQLMTAEGLNFDAYKAIVDRIDEQQKKSRVKFSN